MFLEFFSPRSSGKVRMAPPLPLDHVRSHSREDQTQESCLPASCPNCPARCFPGQGRRDAGVPKRPSSLSLSLSPLQAQLMQKETGTDWLRLGGAEQLRVK